MEEEYLPFCDWCSKEEKRELLPYFELSGGDIDSSELEFCTPKCLLDWIKDTYVIHEKGS
jgi:hypothetical protein